MANIASNTYLFYGDKAELVKCHDKLNKLHELLGDNISCVDRNAENAVVNYEWIDYIDKLNENDDSFRMGTHSKWYGNPVYWDDWVKANYPKLSVAFMCEECSMGIFEKVDPDNKFDDYLWIQGPAIPEEDIAKLPQVLKDAIDGGDVYGTFIKDEVFNSEFQPSDLPDSVTYKEYENTTYDEIRASDAEFLDKLVGMKKDYQRILPDNMWSKTYVPDLSDAVKTKTAEYIDKWKENDNTRKNLLS